MVLAVIGHLIPHESKKQVHVLLGRCKEATQTSLKAKVARGLSHLACEDKSSQSEIKSDKMTRLKVRRVETRSDRLKQGHVGYAGYGEAS